MRHAIANSKEALAHKKDSILTLLKVFDMKHDLDSLRDEIKEEVANEIILRYYYQRGQSEHSLLQDTLVKKAAQLVADQKRYSDILQSTNKKNKDNKKK